MPNGFLSRITTGISERLQAAKREAQRIGQALSRTITRIPEVTISAISRGLKRPGGWLGKGGVFEPSLAGVGLILPRLAQEIFTGRAPARAAELVPTAMITPPSLEREQFVPQTTPPGATTMVTTPAIERAKPKPVISRTIERIETPPEIRPISRTERPVSRIPSAIPSVIPSAIPSTIPSTIPSRRPRVIPPAITGITETPREALIRALMARMPERVGFPGYVTIPEALPLGARPRRRIEEMGF